ncbi:MAG: hypothetical protein AAGF87_08025 [Bacteroidota bacterium]
MYRLLALVFLLSCGSNEPEVYSNQTSQIQAVPCPPDLGLLDGNSYTDPSRNLVVALHQMGDGWALDIYNREECALENRVQLPKPEIEDYPYYLADLLYNSALGQVGIRGPRHFFIYQLDQKSLSEPITPSYSTERLSGASSGQIEHLEVWEDYLIGCTVDWGAFAARMDGTALLPLAELEIDERYASLFLIEVDASDSYQAVMPRYNYELARFEVNPLFSAPISLDLDNITYAKGSSYVRLQTTGGESITIDLSKAKIVEAIQEVDIN